PLQQIGCQSSRRPPAGVEAVDGAALRFVIEDEQIAAESVARRLHQANRGVGGNRRVDGVATALEDLHTRACGERLTRGDNPESRRDDGAADDWPLWSLRLTRGSILRACADSCHASQAHQHAGRHDSPHVHGDPPSGRILLWEALLTIWTGAWR